MRIEQITEQAQILAGADQFDNPLNATATELFLNSSGHHLLFAFDDEGNAIGMVSGVETTHPDKGTEMFLYELGVAFKARGQGVGTALVEALANLAKDRGCYGMWTATEPDNAAALATYRRAGANEEESSVVLSWHLSESSAARTGAS